MAGRSGATITQLPEPNPAAGKAFGFTASRTNFNKDGVPDIFLSNLSNHERTDVPQEAYVFEGRSGSLLKLFQSSEREGSGGRRPRHRLRLELAGAGRRQRRW